MSLKLTEELRVMTMKNDATFEEELTCRLKIDMRNLRNFYQSTQWAKFGLKNHKIFRIHFSCVRLETSLFTVSATVWE